MHCVFEKIDDHYECMSCKYKTKIEGLKRNCGGIPFIKRGVNFTKSVVKHVINKSPKATEEQIKERLEICKTCELFRNNICNHNSCGCNIKDTKVFLNKLAWADQECPLKKWTKIE